MPTPSPFYARALGRPNVTWESAITWPASQCLPLSAGAAEVALPDIRQDSPLITASAGVGIARIYISPTEHVLKDPGATILFRIARLYGKSIEWPMTGAGGEGRCGMLHTQRGSLEGPLRLPITKP
jgi:hypothetical protein